VFDALPEEGMPTAASLFEQAMHLAKAQLQAKAVVCCLPVLSKDLVLHDMQ